MATPTGQSKEIYVKAKARIAALFGRSGSRRSQGPALAAPSPNRRAAGSGAPTRRSPHPHPRARSLVLSTLLLAAACALAFSAAPALALQTHGFSTSFGSPGSGAGQLGLSSPSYWAGIYLQTAGSGLAVNDQTHDVYVADSENHRVDQFSSSGTFIRAWGWGVESGASESQTCTELTGCQPGLSGSEPAQFESPAFVAVDNASGPEEGDVYVADAGDHRVSKFTPAGALIETWARGGLLNGSTTTTPFGNLAGIAVDPSGNLWVYANGEGYSSRGEMFEFAPDGSFTTEWPTNQAASPAGIATDSAGNLYVTEAYSGTVYDFTPSGAEIGPVAHPSNSYVATLGLAVDSSTGDLYLDGGEYIHERLLPATTAYHFPASCDTGGDCAPSDTFGAGNISAAAGLAVDPADHTVYVADPGAQRIDVFTGPFVFPEATTQPATEVTLSPPPPP